MGHVRLAKKSRASSNDSSSCHVVMMVSDSFFPTKIQRKAFRLPWHCRIAPGTAQSERLDENSALQDSQSPDKRRNRPCGYWAELFRFADLSGVRLPTEELCVLCRHQREGFAHFLNDTPPAIVTAEVMFADMPTRVYTSHLFGHAAHIKDYFAEMTSGHLRGPSLYIVIRYI